MLQADSSVGWRGASLYLAPEFTRRR